MSMEQTNN